MSDNYFYYCYCCRRLCCYFCDHLHVGQCWGVVFGGESYYSQTCLLTIPPLSTNYLFREWSVHVVSSQNIRWETDCGESSSANPVCCLCSKGSCTWCTHRFHWESFVYLDCCRLLTLSERCMNTVALHLSSLRLPLSRHFEAAAEVETLFSRVQWMTVRPSSYWDVEWPIDHCCRSSCAVD